MALPLQQLSPSIFKAKKPDPARYKPRFAPTCSVGRSLIESGTIQSIPPKEASLALGSGGFKLLDVRPVWERERALVQGSIHVPLFVEETDESLITLLRKSIHLGYIGLWTGQLLTTINPHFVQQVQEAVPDYDAKLLVACGEGLRSVMAVKRLHEKGYRNLGWLQGGFNRSFEGDFQGVEGSRKLQYATIGGISWYFLQVLLVLQGQYGK